MACTNITKESFDEFVMNIGKPVLLDFWAPWCGPCKQVGPIVEGIGEDREDIIVAKVNVDEEMELAVKFGIVSIPTLIVMKDGKVANTAVGYRPKADILKLLGK